jgi:hypothetical protein
LLHPLYNRSVATAVDSTARRERSLSNAQLRLSILEAWHLLSLDAPTVAALWSIFFARVMRIHLPWHSPLILALGTWLIYVADRLLDGYRPAPSTILRERHRFHARHRAAFLIAAAVTSAVLIWLIVDKMTSAARSEDIVLFLLSLLYMFLVHRPAMKTRRWLPKELAVGIVFAAATAVPAWSRLDAGRAALLPAVALFAAICCLNCVAIERWENGSGLDAGGNTGSHLTTRWTANHLRVTALVLAATSGTAGAVAFGHSSSTTPLYLAVLASSTLFVAIDGNRERFSIPGLRIGADVALLTPLLLLPLA